MFNTIENIKKHIPYWYHSYRRSQKIESLSWLNILKWEDYENILLRSIGSAMVVERFLNLSEKLLGYKRVGWMFIQRYNIKLLFTIFRC